ncbi:MAG: YabP/YqfC family sporulation protein [Clostridia bacterium]|nr:YabP/YqfC family sporulation protein [Clostridia bacterium]MDE6614304.1 YabP/YqfC family sporulation protein [Clostridia bacterium]
MSQIASTVTTKPQKSITIDFDSSIVINGITNMIESDDKQIIAALGDKTLIITGEKLNVVSLDTARYTCSVSGSLLTLKYVKGRQKVSFFKRIFK